jgi:hypothetical protein
MTRFYRLEVENYLEGGALGYMDPELNFDTSVLVMCIPRIVQRA